MDPNGDKIRQILAKAGQAMERADGAMKKAQGAMGGADQMATPSGGPTPGSPGCMRMNLRGECANPNLMGEYGNMSWREYDALKAAGKDPEEVSHQNLNKPRPWLESRSLARRNY